MGLRIIWSSNAIWAPTGYGVQAKSILPRLKALGHECAQFAWYGVQGAVLDMGGMKIYPAFADPWGHDIIGAHVQDFKADIVISLQDNWVLPLDYVERCRPARWASWFPVDASPLPERVRAVTATADYPIVYSQFGLREAEKAGIQADYIPHGVETDVYKPGDKLAARAAMGWPADAYICTMVAANKGMPSRKAFPEQLLAFAEFRSRHPEAMLYLHTVRSAAHQGVEFDALIPACGIPWEAVRFVDQYRNAVALPPEYLATVYQGSDVLLAAATSEGFGIPIIEAQACGCPAITTDCTSMPELTYNGIATVPAQPMWGPLNAWAAVPSVRNITAALEEIYGRSEEERTEQAAFGVKMVHQEYSWGVLVERYWRPFLGRVERDIHSEAPAVVEPVAVAV